MSDTMILLTATLPILLLSCMTGENQLVVEGDDAPNEDSAPALDDTDTSAGPPPDLSIEPTTVAPPFETAVLQAGASDVTVASYTWTLATRPEGSSATLYEDRGPTAWLTPDLAGNYEVQLVVLDIEGNSSVPASAWLSATPSQALWVEMFWTVSPDDMDLHVLAPGGELESDTDCYYANCVGGGPDWGVEGDNTDDPTLDLDDIPGVGPENINIDQPHDGEFQVWVHDYQGSTADTLGHNSVTVQVYLDGVLAWKDTKTISGDDTDTPYCSVTYPEAVVTAL
jgi:hypothetical protein